MANSEAPSRNAGEGKLKAGKGKGKAETEDESMHQEYLDDIYEYIAFLSRRFSKLKFKRNTSMSKPIPSYRKDSQHNDLLLTCQNSNVSTVGLLGISPMNAGSPRLRRKKC